MIESRKTDDELRKKAEPSRSPQKVGKNGDPVVWLIWGVTRKGFSELLEVSLTEERARQSERYIRACMNTDLRLVRVAVEEREANHAYGSSMFGVGPVPRAMEDLG